MAKKFDKQAAMSSAHAEGAAKNRAVPQEKRMIERGCDDGDNKRKGKKKRKQKMMVSLTISLFLIISTTISLISSNICLFGQYLCNVSTISFNFSHSFNLLEISSKKCMIANKSLPNQSENALVKSLQECISGGSDKYTRRGADFRFSNSFDVDTNKAMDPITIKTGNEDNDDDDKTTPNNGATTTTTTNTNKTAQANRNKEIDRGRNRDKGRKRKDGGGLRSISGIENTGMTKQPKMEETERALKTMDKESKRHTNQRNSKDIMV